MEKDKTEKEEIQLTEKETEKHNENEIKSEKLQLKEEETEKHNENEIKSEKIQLKEEETEKHNENEIKSEDVQFKEEKTEKHNENEIKSEEIQLKEEETEKHNENETETMSKRRKEALLTAIKLSDIPKWSENGPNFIKRLKPIDPETILYPPNSEINDLISYIPRGDSTALKVDAIVNAANSGLSPGGGICGCIHHSAGSKLAKACAKIGFCPTGKAVVTPGFDLPSNYVIHAVGPIGENPEKLTQVYESTLACIDGQKIRSVALCCISTGIYGYPIKPATEIALNVVRKFLEDSENREKTDRIIFVVFTMSDCKVYEKMLPLYFPIELESENKEANNKHTEEEEEEDAKKFEIE